MKQKISFGEGFIKIDQNLIKWLQKCVSIVLRCFSLYLQTRFPGRNPFFTVLGHYSAALPYSAQALTRVHPGKGGLRKFFFEATVDSSSSKMPGCCFHHSADFAVGCRISNFPTTFKLDQNGTIASGFACVT